MDEQALRDYDYVAWDGHSSYVAAPTHGRQPVVLDTTEIWLATERELRYWTNELGVTVYAIRDAIVETGTRASETIRAHLAAPPPA